MSAVSPKTTETSGHRSPDQESELSSNKKGARNMVTSMVTSPGSATLGGETTTQGVGSAQLVTDRHIHDTKTSELPSAGRFSPEEQEVAARASSPMESRRREKVQHYLLQHGNVGRSTSSSEMVDHIIPPHTNLPSAPSSSEAPKQRIEPATRSTVKITPSSDHHVNMPGAYPVRGRDDTTGGRRGRGINQYSNYDSLVIDGRTRGGTIEQEHEGSAILAYARAVGDSERSDHDNVFPTSTTSPTENYDHEHEEDEDPEEPVIAVATKLGLLSYITHDRRTQIGAVLLVLLLIGLTVGLVVATSNKGNGTDKGKLSPGDEDPWPKLQVGSSLNGTPQDSQFGASVSLNGNGTRLAIGSPGVFDDNVTTSNGTSSSSVVHRGIVHVYEAREDINSSGTEWMPLGQPISGNFVDDKDDFNTSKPLSGIKNRLEVEMSRDGNFIAVGAPFHDDGDDNKNVGQVQIFQFNTSTEGDERWERVGEPIRGKEPDDFFGASISLSKEGGYVAIGAPGNGNETGRVYVYQQNRETWERRGYPINGTVVGDMFGGSVSLSNDGTRVAMGASHQHIHGNSSVVAKVYQFRSGDWSEIGSGIKGGDQLYDTGWSAELSGDGNILVISNYYMDDDGPKTNSDEENSLLVMAFQFDGVKEWTPLGENMHAKEKGDKSGYFISVSDDGKTIVMGDPGRSFQGASHSGHAHIYKYNDQQWNQAGPNINGEDAWDMSGLSVSLSADGQRFAIGAPFSRRATGKTDGRVKVYDVHI